MKNPIIDNRMVSSHTYAVRNLALLCSIFPDYCNSGIMCEEEFEYMVRVACNLLQYQVETCPDSEKWYFRNLVKDYRSGKDIILGFICQGHDDFAHYLKAIHAI